LQPSPGNEELQCETEHHIQSLNIDNTVKTQSRIVKIITRAALVLMATAFASTSKADGNMAFADFNGDGLVDVATLTSSTTVTVSLANPDGSYTVSAVLSASTKKALVYVHVGDFNGDGLPDVLADTQANGGWITTYRWPGNGNGTFGFYTTFKWSWPPKRNVWF
jgi:hypothetical protein